MKRAVILCVDDEKAILTSLKAQLINSFGREYNIEIAETGEEALEIIDEIKLKKINLPVVIADHIMPGMKGDELLARIYQIFPRTNNIMLTGQADVEAVGRAVNNAHLYRYISKPWNPTDLNLTIAEAVKSYFQDETILEQNQELDKLVHRLKNYSVELEEKVKERTEEVSKQKDELKENLKTIRTAHKKLSVSEKKLKELDEFKSKFFANISHEFRTPLSLILASIDDLLISEILSKDHEYAINLIKKNSDRLYRLVKQLLELSKLDEGKMKILLQKGDINNTIKDILSNYDSLAKRKRIKFNIQNSEGSIKGFWDQEKLEMIVHNLLSNAFKYTPEYGEICFEFGLYSSKDIPAINIENNSENSYKGKYLNIKISDSGPGIPANKMDKIFERFEKVGVDQKLYSEGMGIGLALTKELVNFQNGFLFVDSKKAYGAIFTVYLPIEKLGFQNAEILEDKTEILTNQLDVVMKLDFEKETSVNQAFKSEKNKEYQSANSNTILIVEDNDDMRNYIAKNLEQKYNIELAIDGEDGIKKAIEIIPDLIVTDLMMPKGDGLSLCDLLKKDERTNHIPIIILTAKASIENRIEGLQTGADHYLEKPFKIEELKVRIENLIKQREKLREKYSKMIGYELVDLEITDMNGQFMKNALALVERNLLNDDWSIVQFSSSLNMSRSQLFRKIKALTEMSVSEFIMTYRLKKAAGLLEKNLGSVSEIAFKVGFNNASYFTKCFQRKYNVTPRSYALHFKNKNT
ncbi:MAG: response regulator [Bacteroidota bacterium]